MGVIEHFWDGYSDIASEMYRVLRPDGYLFLTFPSMSFTRRLKAKYGKYEIWRNGTDKPGGFYQFALNSHQVRSYFTKIGFEVIDSYGIGGMKGLKDEIDLPILKAFFQEIYNKQGLFFRVLKKIINFITNQWVGHGTLLILRKI